jgi:hypothetical protein
MSIDIPNLPPQNVPVIIAQANQTQVNNMQTERTIGVCHPLGADSVPSGEDVIAPKVYARLYLNKYEKKEVKNTTPATITILQQPMHGTLRLVTQADIGTILDKGGEVDSKEGLHIYLPQEGYIGKDKAIVLVDIADIKVKVIYFFQTVAGPSGEIPELCAKRGYFWKISSNFIPSSNRALATSLLASARK